jgi:hypothetical protein
MQFEIDSWAELDLDSDHVWNILNQRVQVDSFEVETKLTHLKLGEILYTLE